MTRFFFAFFLASFVCASAFAEDVVVVLPSDRVDAFRAAVRLEVENGTSVLVVATPMRNASTFEAVARAEGERVNARTLAWIDFPSGQLCPPRLSVEDVATHATRTTTLAFAYDVIEPRLFAVTLASLVATPTVESSNTRLHEEPIEAPPSQEGAPNALIAAPPVVSSTEASPPSVTQSATTVESTGPRRIVYESRLTRSHWFLRLGGQMSGLWTTDASRAVGAPLGSFGFGAYVAPRWRIEAEVAFGSTLDARLISPGTTVRSYQLFGLQSLGASYVHSFGFFALTVGARLQLSEVPVQTASFDTVAAQPDIGLGGGAHVGGRFQLSPHWALELRVGYDASYLLNTNTAMHNVYGALFAEYVF